VEGYGVVIARQVRKSARLRVVANLMFVAAAGQDLLVSIDLPSPSQPMYQVPSMQQFEALAAQVAALTAQVEAMKANSSETLARTYHLGPKPTPGRGYDDRLTTRTGIGKTKLRELLEIGPVRGGLRRARAGDRFLVTETAVREWLGDL
jgi:hypothetical protein